MSLSFANANGNMCACRFASVELRSRSRAAANTKNRSKHSQKADKSQINCLPTVPASQSNNFNTFAISPCAAKNAMQLKSENYNLPKASKTKTHLLLLIVLCAILVQSAYATPVPAPVPSVGEKLILHTPEHRLQYHQQLLLQRRTQAPPTSRHHRHHLHHRSADMDPSISNTGKACLIKTMQKEAEHTIYLMLSNLTDYVPERFNGSTVAELHEDWRLHRLEWQHPFQKLLTGTDRHYNKTVQAKEVISSSISNEEFVTFLRNAYITVKVMRDVFDEAIEYFNANKANKIHFLTVENFRKIVSFLEKSRDLVLYNLGESQNALEQLGIEIPNTNVANVKFQDLSTLDWLLAKEFLIIVQYLRGLYEGLHGICATTPSFEMCKC